MKKITLGLLIIFIGSGCFDTGITRGERGDEGGDADSEVSSTPTTPFVNTSSTGGGVVPSGNLTLFVRTSATSFRGGLRGETIQVTDPILKSGADRVMRSVSDAE